MPKWNGRYVAVKEVTVDAKEAKIVIEFEDGEKKKIPIIPLVTYTQGRLLFDMARAEDGILYVPTEGPLEIPLDIIETEKSENKEA